MSGRDGAQTYHQQSSERTGSFFFFSFFLNWFLSSLQISRDESQGFAREHRIHYMEASAKNRYNVDEAFLEVVRAIR